MKSRRSMQVTVKTFEDTMREMARVFRQSFDRKISGNPIFEIEPGIRQLLHTFTPAKRLELAGAPLSPFFQEVSIETHISNRDTVDLRFDWVSTCAEEYAKQTDSAFQILLWEPIFSGQVRVQNPKQFELFCNAFCGAGAWIRDLVIVPSVRDCAPLGEIFINQMRQTQANFYPYRTFSKCKENAIQYLPYYVEMFTAGKSMRMGPAFNRAFLKYYSFPYKDATALYDSLGEIGFWGDYYDCFLGVEGLPTLIEPHISKLLSQDRVAEYVSAVYRHLSKRIAMTSARAIETIRLRRQIQQRAYQAFQVYHYLATGMVFSQSGISRRSRVTLSLKVYLKHLEVQLLELSRGRKKAAVKAEIRSADEFYNKAVRSYLKKTDTRGIFVSSEDPIWEVVEREFARKNVKTGLQFRVAPQQTLAILRAIVRSAELNSQDVCVGPTELAMQTSIRDSWSYPLSRVVPSRNEFCEMLPLRPGRLVAETTK